MTRASGFANSEMSFEPMSWNWTVNTLGSAHSPSFPKPTSPTTVLNFVVRVYSARAPSSVPCVPWIACPSTCSWA